MVDWRTAQVSSSRGKAYPHLPPLRSARRLFYHCAIATCVAALPLRSQVSRSAALVGSVLVAGDTVGVPGAQVELIGQSLSTTTNRLGSYRFAPVKSGPDVLRVRLVGYRSMMVAVAIQQDSTTNKDIQLERLPTTLTEVRIEGEMRKVPPRFEDVYRRMATAHGSFFTREDIDRLNPPNIQSLVMRVGTARVNDKSIQFAKCEAGGAFALSGRPNKSTPTSVQIYIDGHRMTGRQQGDADAEQREVLRLVNPSQVQAIEVYTGVSRIPGEFLEDACAVIAIWTRSY
ncbi:MAG: carboxypeptidase-like regulatory domain-containing protein [bacterium]